MFQRQLGHLPKRRFLSSSRLLYSEFSHLVIGGGCVGVSVGAELQAVKGNSVLLVEKNEALGQETTSRNSEVIHAGLYYPPNSLKAQLSVRGKERIYNAHDKGYFQVPLRKCGKLIVAQDADEFEYLDKIHNHAKDLGVETKFINSNSVSKSYPLIRAEAGALSSPTTGIISAHDLTLFYEGRLENEGGTVVLNTEVVDISYNGGLSNYSVYLKEKGSLEVFEIQVDNIVNASGLHAPKVSNLLLPSDRHFVSHFAKGTYFGFSSKASFKTSDITNTLIYPCPNIHAASLGTHLTVDLAGQLKFGPDLEWLKTKNADEIDYTGSERNVSAAVKAIKRYFPEINSVDLQATYSGVRPKRYGADESKEKFVDFLIREEEGYPGFVNLIGIESPGLTASWAIGEYVKDLYHK